MMPMLRRVAVLPIQFYRRCISPWTPPSCRFEPSCSEYGEAAVLRHGVFKGTVLIVWRILRCQPFSRGGHDPVPEPGTWSAPHDAAPSSTAVVSESESSSTLPR